MGQYFYTLICASLFCTVVAAIAPGGAAGKTGKHLAFIGAVAISLCILSPLPGFLKEKDLTVPKGPEAAEGDTESLAEYYANSAAMTLEMIYGTSVQEQEARVICNDSGEVKRVELYVSGEVAYSTENAGKVLSDIYGLEIEVKGG